MTTQTCARAAFKAQWTRWISPAITGVLALLIVTAVSTPAAAQAGSGAATLQGEVLGPDGRPIANGAVSVVNNDTGYERMIITDERGRYVASSIPVGSYAIEVFASDFSRARRDQVRLAVGQIATVDFSLQLANFIETIIVTGPSQLVDTTSTHVGGIVTPDDIDSLPLNGRNFLDLALLSPNVSRTNTRNSDRFAETSAVPGTGISIAGQRSLSNTFVVDGLSANDDAAALVGTYYGEEVIREFRVITSGGSAEFGRALAGAVSIVTQSGTNAFRGRAYGFFRDDKFDEANALATTKDPFTQRQYGFSFGGPLVQDRTFWFANVERTQQDKTGYVTISQTAVDGINTAFDNFGYRGPRAETGAFPTGYHTLNIFNRVDHQLGDEGSRLEFRHNMYDMSSPNSRGAGGLNAVSRGVRLDNLDHTVGMTLQTALSSSTINDTRVQYMRSRLAAPVNDTVGPAVLVSGAANIGTSSFNPTARDIDALQATNTLAVLKGSHQLKTGVDFLYDRVTIAFPGLANGQYSFSSVANLQTRRYTTFQQAFGEFSILQANPNLGVFAQDEWHPRTGLTLNLGVRYDLQLLPSEAVKLDDNNISPRLGVAWAITPHSVIRASGGIYYDRTPLRATSNALLRDGVKFKTASVAFGQAGAPVFPAILPSLPTDVRTAIFAIDPEAQNARSEQASVQIEQGIGQFATATAGYSRLRGRQILMLRNVNVPTLTTAQANAIGDRNLGRPNPNFGNISRYEPIGDSWFQGFTASFGTRNTSWSSARVSYTLSKSEDTAGNNFFSTPQDNSDVAAERGPSDQDQRHRLVVSGTLGGHSGMTTSTAMAGFQFGWVASWATGVPFTAVTGNDRNNDTTVNDRPVGVGRNSERQPSTATVDLRLSRSFSIGSRQRLEAMLEAFNVFNRANVIAVNPTFGTGATPVATFGQTTIMNDPRQLQLGLRWNF